MIEEVHINQTVPVQHVAKEEEVIELIVFARFVDPEGEIIDTTVFVQSVMREDS